MTTIEQRILKAIAADLAAILARGKPEGYGWADEKIAFDLAEQSVIRTDPSRWTGWSMAPAERMRFVRTLKRLEGLGYIRRHAAYEDGYLTHVQLLDAGREALAALAASQGVQVDA